ncbi:MAG: Trimethylamine methyltransferase (MTTB) [bacterium ADurb.Bin429]|nr:MAG: Trimethylamine methyltransferase (MTTB) [bacterium ADurb.Bin429]
MLRERLHGVGGFMVTDQRIYPGEARIQAYVFELRARKQTPPDDLDAQPLLRYSDRPLYTISDDDVSLRPLTTQDVIAGTKLGYALYDRGIRGAACGLPSDVDPLYAPFEQLLIGLRYGRCGGYSSHAFTPWHMRYVAHIFQVLGWDFGVSVWMPSPFRLEGNELEIALALEGTYTSLGVGSMPLMGITAPMNELQTWAQGLAETLGAAAILQAAFPGITIDIYPHPKPADMTTGQYGVGTPEWNFMDALKMEILPFYGLRPPWGKGASIGAILPGPQATLERTAQYLTGYLHGYRVFDEAGIMAGGEVYSSVQLLFDLEAMEWVARYGRGTHLDNDTVDLERWAEIAASETLFAEDAEEVAKLRDVYSRNSRLFPCTTVGQHLTLPRDALADAKAEIRRLIANHAYEPDAAIMREAEAIVAHARAHPPA